MYISMVASPTEEMESPLLDLVKPTTALPSQEEKTATLPIQTSAHTESNTEKPTPSPSDSVVQYESPSESIPDDPDSNEDAPEDEEEVVTAFPTVARRTKWFLFSLFPVGSGN